mmetsp:Transcript_13357/g.37483  ORF Transcript_13357/g.37483 Transcript_13357/m.37483 type:complete len:99 (-) Transcript_13357:1617-1913(-)
MAAMNAPVNFMRTNLLRYWENYFLKKPFRPVVHVMWTIGIAGAWYEGYHHRKLEKLHMKHAEVKRVELKEKHGFGKSLKGSILVQSTRAVSDPLSLSP